MSSTSFVWLFAMAKMMNSPEKVTDRQWDLSMFSQKKTSKLEKKDEKEKKHSKHWSFVFGFPTEEKETGFMPKWNIPKSKKKNKIKKEEKTGELSSWAQHEITPKMSRH